MAMKRGIPPRPMWPGGLGFDLRDFDFEGAAERMRKTLHNWSTVGDPTPRGQAQHAPRRGPPPWPAPRCWRCGVQLTVRFTPIGNGGREYEVSCHGETQQVRVPNAELDAMKIGYGFAFKPE